MALRPDLMDELAAEITSDPNGYGLVALRDAGNDQGISDALNLVRTGANGGPAITVNRGTISTQELVEAVVQSEMPTNASQRDWLIMLASGTRVRVDTGSTARAGLLAIFGAATTTRANLTAVSSRPGSRAEQLFGVGTQITNADVATALRGG